MDPIIADRLELVNNGLMYKGILMSVGLEDTSQDLKRAWSNRKFRFSTTLNSCMFCHANTETIVSQLGSFSCYTQEELSRLQQAGQVLQESGSSARAAGRESHGHDTSARGADQAQGINQRSIAVHFDALHWAIAFAR